MPCIFSKAHTGGYWRLGAIHKEKWLKCCVARIGQQNFVTQLRHVSVEAWKLEESDHSPIRQAVNPNGHRQ